MLRPKHDRAATASGCWKWDGDRAAACVVMLVGTDGEPVDVAPNPCAELVPGRWASVTEAEAASGLEASNRDRILTCAWPLTGLVGPARTEAWVASGRHCRALRTRGRCCSGAASLYGLSDARSSRTSTSPLWVHPVYCGHARAMCTQLRGSRGRGCDSCHD